MLNSDVDESEKEALQTDLENYSGIDELLEMYCQNIELQTDKKTVDAVLEVPKELTNFNDFYAFRDRKSGEVYEFPTDGGAAISEKTATMLGVKAGDTVQLKKGDDIVDVKISIIVENYVRHYLYLAPDLYEELFGGAPDYNQLLMKYQDTSSNYETSMVPTLKNAFSGSSSIAPSTIILKPRIVSRTGTYLPGKPVKTSATLNG